MKKSIILTFFLFSLLSLSGQKVALHSAGGVQLFTGTNGFIDALNAASAGDTIYLPGAGFNAPANIAKPVTIFGAGHYPDSTLATSKTFINATLNILDGADGLHIEGVEVNGHIKFEYNKPVNNVVIKYCRMMDFDVYGNATFLTPSVNVTLLNNVITGAASFSNAVNAAMFNCIVGYKVLNTYGNLFENNIFLYSYTGASAHYVINGDNNICRNNIFLNASNRYFAGVSNQIHNNLFVASPPTYGTTPVESGNYSPVVQDDIFQLQSGNLFDYAHNYHLKSPATWLGVDGSEAGVYGGIYGYKEGAVPSNPHLQTVTVSPTTDATGKITITVKAAAQQK